MSVKFIAYSLLKNSATQALALVLFVFCLIHVQAANAQTSDQGEVSSVIVDKEGWNIYVTLAGFKKGGQYELNAEQKPKVTVKVFSEGYNTQGKKIVVERQLIATSVIRKTYPQHTQLEEIETNSGLVVALALNKPVYNDDKKGGAGTSGKNPVITFQRGWYVDNGAGGSGKAAKPTTITAKNESALDYPKVVGDWAWPARETVSSDITLETVFFHASAKNQKPVALVKYFLSNQRGQQGQTASVRNLTISSRQPKNHVLVYSAKLKTQSFQSGDTLKARFIAYPWIGDQNSIFDSQKQSDNSERSYDDQIYYYVSNQNKQQSIAYVDGLGDDSTGLVSEQGQSSSAKNHPFKTIAGAIDGLVAFNLLNYGRADVSNSVIYLTEGKHQWIDGNVRTMQQGNSYLTITKPNNAKKELVIITSSGKNNKLSVPHIKLSDITLSREVTPKSAAFMTGSEQQSLWVDHCTIDGKGHKGPMFYKFGKVSFTNNEIKNALNVFSYSVTKQVAALVRDNTIQASGTIHPYNVIGNTIYDTRLMRDDVNPNIPSFDNGIITYNQFLDLSNFAYNFAATKNIDHGIAIVQNVFERAKPGPSPLLQISGDSSLTTTNHVLVWHNTLVGQRSNLFYNDVGSQPYRQQNMSVVGNIMNEFNIKSDLFFHPKEGQNNARIGNWEALYGSGFYGNVSHTGATSNSFEHEFFGLDSIWNEDPLFEHDASFDTGNGQGKGNYQIKPGSPAEGLMNRNQVLPYDLNGVSRVNDCYGAAGAFERRQAKVICIQPVNVQPFDLSLKLSWRFPANIQVSQYRVFRQGEKDAIVETTSLHFLDKNVVQPKNSTQIEYTIQALNNKSQVIATIKGRYSLFENALPQAIAGSDQHVTDLDRDGQASVTLDASDSFDPDGQIQSYTWLVNNQIVANGVQATVSFAKGEHAITLKVVDNNGAEAVDELVVKVVDIKTELRANAGQDQTVIDTDIDGKETIILDASRSTIQLGTIERYDWFEGNKPIGQGKKLTVSLSEGEHTIKLIIVDNLGLTATDTVNIRIEKARNKPQSRQIVLNGWTTDQEIYDDGNKKWIGRHTARVGGASSTQDGALILVFKLPAIDVGEYIQSAEFKINLSKTVNRPQGHVDFYGLNYRGSALPEAEDYYQGAFGLDRSDAYAIEDDWVTRTTKPGWLSLGQNGLNRLADFLNQQISLGAQSGDYVFFRLNPDVQNVTNYYFWEFFTANSQNPPQLILSTETKAQSGINLAPIAEAGGDQSLIDENGDGEEIIQLDASGSFDKDGTIASYQWYKTDKLIADGKQAAIALPIGSHSIKLVVTDRQGKTAEDEIKINIEKKLIINGRQLQLLGLTTDQEIYDDGKKKWVGRATARVGGASRTQDSALILVFQLPKLNQGEQISSANLSIHLQQKDNRPEGNIDVYGLGFRSSPETLPTDYYQGAFEQKLDNAMQIQDDFVTPKIAPGSLSLNTVGRNNLSAYLNEQYQLGAKQGDYVFIRLNPDALEISSYNYWEFYTADSNFIPEISLTTDVN